MNDLITSPSNQHIALLRSLHTPKGREQEGACLLEGPHLLAAAFEARVTPRLIVYEQCQQRRGRQQCRRGAEPSHFNPQNAYHQQNDADR